MPATTQAAPVSESRDLGLQTRLAPFETIDAATRTVQVVWSTGARVRRYDYWNERWYDEELSMLPEHVRMGRFQSGKSPLLDSHNRWRLGNVMGVVENAALAAGTGTGAVRFSKRADVEPYYQDVLDGIIGQSSIGYSIYKMERIAPASDADVWVYRAIDWEPYELSLVAVGADPDAGTRSIDGVPQPPKPGEHERMTRCVFVDVPPQTPAAAGNSTQERTMPGDNTTPTPAATNAATQSTTDAAVRAALDAEHVRIAGIREAVTLGGMDAAYADQLIGQRELTPAEAGLAVLREKAKRSQASPSHSAAHIQTIDDQAEGRREAMIVAVMHRASPRVVKLTDGARHYCGMTLRELAREELERAGISTRGMSPLELAGAALGVGSRAGFHTTSDMPLVFGGAISRTMRNSYDGAEKTFVQWARQGSLNDFRPVTRIDFSAAVQFERKRESGEYKYGELKENGETYKLGTYGKAVAFTREMIINDDLSALERLPTFFGSAAADMESDLVYEVLTSNPRMSDGKQLFSAEHKNLGTGAAIGIDSLSAGREAMRTQVGSGGKSAMNLQARFLLVPAALETVAWQYTQAAFVAAQANAQNPFAGKLEPIVEPRLDAVSRTAWFLAADGSRLDTVEYAYLAGEEGLFIEQSTDFDHDAIKVKGRIDFAAKAIDSRGLYKNPGA